MKKLTFSPRETSGKITQRTVIESKLYDFIAGDFDTATFHYGSGEQVALVCVDGVVKRLDCQKEGKSS